ncbi:aminotransferase class I/II-fold pyridoxal phosphate-dependent enzyme [Halosegnis sp.]|uniref:aminotransferase class I/II-fold pyridoxal phosphate-dependent enzyme n=1 Tax=Halosegnis sp. TaxID=2864959 RepID=UPI0035D4DF12
MNREAVRATERVPHGSSDDPDVLDFSANINTQVPDGAQAAYDAALDESRSYPPESYPEFRAAAAEYVNCRADEVVPMAGGLAAIRLAVAVSVEAGESALVPKPSFAEYAREVELQGGDPVFVSHDEMLAADPAPHALAIVCNPNNPTGEAYNADALRAFARRCRAAETTLLVDEAFLGFTGEPSLAGEPGVVVARSLTKLFGYPGLRAGFAVTAADTDLYDRLATARPTWSLGWPAARVGRVCMRDEAFVATTRERVARERAFLDERLSRRFQVHNSDAPFLLVDVGEDPAALLNAARERGVVLRDATTFRGLDSHVRVAVRDRVDNERLLAALDIDVPD